MLTIALICNGGLSASILMKKIRIEAEVAKLKIQIEAIALQNISILDRVDMILLSPQVAYALKQVQSYTNCSKHILIIDSFDYASLNAKKIVQDICHVVEKEAQSETTNS